MSYFFFASALRFCSWASFRSSSALGTCTSLRMNTWNRPNGESGGGCAGFGLVAIQLETTILTCVHKQLGKSLYT